VKYRFLRALLFGATTGFIFGSLSAAMLWLGLLDSMVKP
jgi:hypothetical protein